jgi:hypothetical protein
LIFMIGLRLGCGWKTCREHRDVSHRADRKACDGAIENQAEAVIPVQIDRPKGPHDHALRSSDVVTAAAAAASLNLGLDLHNELLSCVECRSNAQNWALLKRCEVPYPKSQHARASGSGEPLARERSDVQVGTRRRGSATVTTTTGSNFGLDLHIASPVLEVEAAHSMRAAIVSEVLTQRN